MNGFDWNDEELTDNWCRAKKEFNTLYSRSATPLAHINISKLLVNSNSNTLTNTLTNTKSIKTINGKKSRKRLKSSGTQSNTSSSRIQNSKIDIQATEFLIDDRSITEDEILISNNIEEVAADGEEGLKDEDLMKFSHILLEKYLLGYQVPKECSFEELEAAWLLVGSYSSFMFQD